MLEASVAAKALTELVTRKDQLFTAKILPQITIVLVLRFLNLLKLSPNMRRLSPKFSQMHLFLTLTCRLSPAILNVSMSMF